MGIATTSGFFGGRFYQGGQFHEGEDEAAPVESIDLEKLTREELVALAKQRSVQHAEGATKAQIIAALTAAS
ncbi:hypothetical protein NS226_13865 [Aureimonas ureilytica]|uniref:Rho termination factor N-terminal domain-containing protein n=1 Tax=Aureimonas ureilytica TaxID=401562 RepID=A0A175R7S3_9HYPH|nr:Rho termination factor N-terminal domain-containing protein [Aureimonas ureilytica]KTQ95013.1 hypothetical protein NS226_13865 [Aureimonas ureilytica]